MESIEGIILTNSDGTQVVFSVGDRVVANCNSEFFTIGDTGTIVVIYNNTDEVWKVGVRFDKEHPRLHALEGECEQHHGRWFYPSSLAHEESECVSVLDFFEDNDEAELPEFNKDEYIRLMFGGEVVHE